jgi:hypothetical protein
MNNGSAFLPFDGSIFYYKATEETSSMIHPPTPVELSTKATVMLPILVSIGAFICTAAIMYFLCYREYTSSPERSVESKPHGHEDDDRRLGIRANDLYVAKKWAALKLPSSRCSFSMGSLANDEHSLPQIFTTSISSDCCSSVSDISAKDNETLVDLAIMNFGSREDVEM